MHTFWLECRDGLHFEPHRAAWARETEWRNSEKRVFRQFFERKRRLRIFNPLRFATHYSRKASNHATALCCKHCNAFLFVQLIVGFQWWSCWLGEWLTWLASTRVSTNGLISSGSSPQTEDTTRSTIPSDHRVALWLALYPSALHCTRNANGGY